jgi:hypothetical protein
MRRDIRRRDRRIIRFADNVHRFSPSYTCMMASPHPVRADKSYLTFSTSSLTQWVNSLFYLYRNVNNSAICEAIPVSALFLAGFTFL